MIKRREFITLVGGAAAWPLAARAQQAGRRRQVGVLMCIANDREGQRLANELRTGLEQFGWIEGRNFGIRNETRSIPLVFVMVSDPVRMGHVESLSHPVGNVTGFTPFEPSLGGKWVELLTEVDHSVKHATLLYNPDTAANAPSFAQPAEAAGSSLGVSVTAMPVRSDADIDGAISETAQHMNSGIILPPDPYTYDRFALILAATARHHMPLITPFRELTARGAVLSYGIIQADEFRRIGTYIDRILRGEKPAELPVQAPTKFILTINQKAAKSLDLEIPWTLLVRADEVIE